MVSLVISLIVVLAATTIYLSTRETQRSIDEASGAHEAGAFALKAIGRELMNAGFYPAVRVESADLINVLPRYLNVTGRAAYDAGIFGCNGATFNPADGTCGTAVAGSPDALVIGYYTNDAFGTSIGQRADCEGVDVAGAAVNLTRVGTGSTSQPPLRPLFVANHYQLTAAQNATIDGRTVAVRSLACDGNGTDATSFTPLVSGIDDLQLTYGVYQDPDTQAPTAFYTAAEVAGRGNLTVDGETVGPWARVVAVRVCVIATTYQSSTATGAAGRNYEACDGTLTAPPAGDLGVRKTYVQVFGVRNRQTFSY